MNWKIVLIVGLALGLRLVWLANLPAGFTADEAGQGYAAYSLLKTGRDEWGQWWPLFPRGFGDFKAPLYTWLTIPSVAAFGLTSWSVRLPEVVIGTLAVWAVYLLAKELFSDKVATWAALLLAISPWAVQLSRNAWEGGVGVLFFTLGWYWWLKNKHLWAAIAFGINLYSYHSWRLVTLAFVGWLLLRQSKKFNWKAGLVFSLFALPILFNLKQTLARAGDVSIISEQNIINYFANKGTSAAPYWVAKILDNKYIYVANQFWYNYSTYFTPAFFFTGNRPDSSHLNFPRVPLLHLIELPALGLGIYLLYRKKHPQGLTLLVWALLAAVPAGLTEGWSAQRAIPFLPLVTLISALGMEHLVSYHWGRQLAIWGLAGGLLFFGYAYLFQLPARPIYSQRVEYEKIFRLAIAQENNYASIHFSRAFSVPQIFVAFYKQWDPSDYQKQSQDWLRYEKANKRYVDQLESYNLGKYEFHDLNWQLDQNRKDALLIGMTQDFPPEVRSIADIYNNQGQVVYRLVPSSQ